MIRFFTLLFFLCIGMQGVYAQTAVRVYDILQDKCVQCHSNASPTAGLDLEGAGVTVAQKMNDVYNNLVDIVPANSWAAGKGMHYIHPGRIDKSFLFHKINGDFDTYYQMDPDGGQEMPAYGADQPLTVEEKELIRQWIQFGAPLSGEVVDESLIYDYYNVNGLSSFPDGPPPAPDPSEGFQLKMGPFFLPPSVVNEEEVEFFWKYDLELEESTEVNRIDIKMGDYSHHFILWEFREPSDANIYQEGFRNISQASHAHTKVISAVQFPTDFRLPNRTAFRWGSDAVLDLNSHYINYSPTHTLGGEAYLNIYTQPTGTADHVMFSEILPNFNIPIPNNGNLITHTDALSSSSYPDIYIWGVMGHTHKYGKEYKVYHRLPGGVKGDLVYDAACPGGIPGCPEAARNYDYQHTPLMLMEPFEKIDISNGIIHEASWINDGPTPLNFGFTSEDEMMVLIFMYTLDTTGISTPVRDIVSVDEIETLEAIPNPMTDQTIIPIPVAFDPELEFTLFDVAGRAQAVRFENEFGIIRLSRGDLPAGIYFYQIRDKFGKMGTGKLIVRDL